MGEEFDTEDNTEMICPWCGCEQSDVFEYGEEGDTECDECGREFLYDTTITVTYTTTKKEVNADAENHH